ncbi:patatin-like phospholipase family protein [Brevundimonas sp. SGAir0440]|uniref:patatin-like phospholipase family protein n=1 Tax=Brevundimonas sp. SGAir0440 TaxID=2579977 RepID=UPI0010CD65A9|nr:patatin-like phospholipase family protein [Brevundimonas sp. SGAir0440]QCQ98984.1 patatin [Brevundimonas sp. SGAir0440]
MRRIGSGLLGVLMVLALSACGTLDRPTGPLRITDSTLVKAEDPRIRASDSARLQAFTQEIGQRLRPDKPTSILALSGGGANGAYGAGLLVGWTEQGDRPTFDVVTGVSTGALAAPFAFLGRDWDDELQHAYTSGAASNLLSWRSFAAFLNPSLFSSQVLRNLVDENVTPELMQAVAREHAKGRRLLVATTDLDSEETVIWDMGLLATQGDENARELFKEVLVASASIPGVFPPVLIAGLQDDDKVVLEMHVDGGVNTPFLAIPEDLMLWTRPKDEGRVGALYVIVNGQVGRNDGVTPGRLSGILGRTYDSMSKSSLRIHLAVTAAFARRNGLDMALSAIPDNVAASSLKFDQETMTAMFELGRQRGRGAGAWTRLGERPADQPFIPQTTISESQVPAVLTPEPSAKPSADMPPADKPTS